MCLCDRDRKREGDGGKGREGGRKSERVREGAKRCIGDKDMYRGQREGVERYMGDREIEREGGRERGRQLEIREQREEVRQRAEICGGEEREGWDRENW